MKYKAKLSFQQIKPMISMKWSKFSKESTVDGEMNVIKSKEEAMNCRSYTRCRDVQEIEL